MNRRFTHCILVLGLGAVPLAAFPHGPYPTPGTGHGFRQEAQVDRIAERLQLTDAQKSRIQEIQDRYAAMVREKAQAAFQADRAFREATRDPGATPAQLKTLYQTKADKTFELLLDRRAKQGELHAVLTPEQRTEWDRLQAYRLGLRQGRRGRGRF